MTPQEALAILLAILLLYLLAGWINQTKRSASIDDSSHGSGKTMDQYLREIPSRELALRIFDPADKDFVLGSGNRETVEVFLAERKELALALLRTTRASLVRFMRFYRLAARGLKGLRLGTELRIALAYLSFLILCDFLIALVWLCGPYATTRLVRVTTGLANELSATAAQTLLPLQPGPHHGPVLS